MSGAPAPPTRGWIPASWQQCLTWNAHLTACGCAALHALEPLPEQHRMVARSHHRPAVSADSGAQGANPRGSQRVRATLNKSSRVWAPWFGMGCKAKTTAIAPAMARICNAADRPKQGCARRKELDQRCPKADVDTALHAERIRMHLCVLTGPLASSLAASACIPGVLALALWQQALVGRAFGRRRHRHRPGAQPPPCRSHGAALAWTASPAWAALSGCVCRTRKQRKLRKSCKSCR